MEYFLIIGVFIINKLIKKSLSNKYKNDALIINKYSRTYIEYGKYRDYNL